MGKKVDIREIHKAVNQCRLSEMFQDMWRKEGNWNRFSEMLMKKKLVTCLTKLEDNLEMGRDTNLLRLERDRVRAVRRRLEVEVYG